MTPLNGSTEISKPVPLEQREIADTINELDHVVNAIRAEEPDTACSGHKSIKESSLINSKANKLNLRLAENILYETQETRRLLKQMVRQDAQIALDEKARDDESDLSWGKLKAKGLPAVIIAVLSALIIGVGFVYYGISKINSIERRIAAVTNHNTAGEKP